MKNPSWPFAAVVLAAMFSAARPAESGPVAACSAANAAALVSIEADTSAVRVGDAVPLHWTRQGVRPAKPAYLVISTPAIVRFEGRGFYALAPGARNPRSVGADDSLTRAIVPLHTPFSPDGGTIDVIPYRAGDVALSWQVVGGGDCAGATSLQAFPGAPVLLPRDEFSSAAPEWIDRAINAPYEAREFDGFIEVVNRETNATILRTAGSDPHFSPTGRFLAVAVDDIGYVDVFDLAAERKLGRFEGYALYWSNADSFLYLDRDFDGRMEIVRTLNGRRYAMTATVDIDVLGFMEGTELEGPRAPDGLDIYPGAGAGSFTAGSEAWALQISLESGTVAFRKVAYENIEGMIAADDNDDGIVIDLGAGAPSIPVTSTAELHAVLKTFGVMKPKVDAWNAGEPLLMAIYADEEEEANDPGFGILVGRTYISQEVTEGEEVTAAPPNSSTVKLRGAVPLNWDEGSGSVRDAAGARFDYVPRTEEPATLRAGRDDAALLEVEHDLAALYPPEIATFGRDESLGYLTRPLPDPAGTPAASADPDDLERLIDLIYPGRDLWSWTKGEAKYWLTQTVESGRLAHTFGLTLLARNGDGSLRHADLLARAEAHVAERDGKQPAGRLYLTEFGDVRSELASVFDTPSAVAVSGGRYLMVATQPLPRLIVFDLATWKIACAIAHPVNPGGIVGLEMHTDLRHLSQIDANGVVEVYDCRTGLPVLNGLHVDGELVVVDNNGFFDGSDDATAYVEMSIPGISGRHLLSQFAAALKVDGLADKVLAGQGSGKPVPVFAPPTVAVRPAEDALDMEAASGTGLSAVEIYGEGRLERRETVSGGRASFTIPLAGSGLGGLTTVVAVDTAGLRSAPVELLLKANGTAGRHSLLGLAVGIDSYPGIRRGDLAFAVADAKRIAATVRRTAFYEAADFKVLSDADATQERILSELRHIVGAASRNDTIVISFAGHGLQDDGKLRLALTATDLDDVANTSLDFDRVINVVKSARARVLILLDVCHAGLAGRAPIATNDDAARSLITESGASLVILSASKGRQFSEESSSAGGGLFSVALDMALGADRTRTDADGNGNISVNELYRALKTSVVASSSGRQTPWIARNRLVGDFDLF